MAGHTPEVRLTLDDLAKLLKSLERRISWLETQVEQRKSQRQRKAEVRQIGSAIDELTQKAGQGLEWQARLYRSIKEHGKERLFD